MSDKERDGERHGDNQTEEPVQDPATDDFEAHRHIERDDSSGLPNRDADPGRDVD